MFLDDENATNVPESAPAPEPAKTAENSSAGGESGPGPESSSAAADETGVSRTVVTLSPEITDAITMIVQAELSTEIRNAIVSAQEQTEVKVKQWLSDAYLELVSRMTTLAGAKPTTGANSPITVRPLTTGVDLNIGDPVKVWADPERKAFRTGEIQAIHDGGHAYDVTIDDGTVTKIGADGLELDDR